MSGTWASCSGLQWVLPHEHSLAGSRELGPVPAGALWALVRVQAHRRQGLGTGNLVGKARALILITSNGELWTHTYRQIYLPAATLSRPASALYQPLGQPTLLQ